jgi:hypothetical protein
MKPEISLLEKNGLIRDQDSLSVEGLSPTRFSRLYEQLYSGIFERQMDWSYAEGQTYDIDPFTFMASASLRADSTCGRFECRSEKLDFLGRYAALYANKVMLPLPISSPDKAFQDPEKARSDLSRAIQSLLHLRPLINAGIVVPIVRRSRHCIHTKKWAATMMEAIQAASVRSARDASSLFRVVYQLPEKAPTGLSTVYITGPKDLIEHGEIVGTWVESDMWRRKSWRYDREGKVELRGPRKLVPLYDLIFEQIANDTGFYLAFARLHSARFLSDLPGETFLLEALDDDEQMSTQNQRIHESLTHLVPLLGDLPISALLRIRRDERDSFIRYRLALQNVLNRNLLGKKKVSKREMQNFFREKIEPELSRMKSELVLERRRQHRRVAGGAVSLAASVALGAFGGFLPLLAKSAAVGASAMVGGRLLSKAAEDACDHGPTFREKNDFYFLLRLAQEK